MKYDVRQFELLSNEEIADGIFDMRVKNDELAPLAKCGQFAHVYVPSKTLRRPISVCDSENGVLRLVYQVKGEGTQIMSRMKKGESVDILAPLGNGFNIEKGKRYCLIGGGIGVPPMLYTAKQTENPLVITGFRNKDLLILEDEFRAASKILHVMTDDGSYGRQGNVCVPLNEMFERGEKFDKVITIGPLIMMKFVVEATRPTGIPCTVSMNPIMIDGTGMCGGCRLTLNVDGKKVTKFACVDGPDFNGYEVDFDEAMMRGTMYRDFERHAHEETCNLFKNDK